MNPKFDQVTVFKEDKSKIKALAIKNGISQAHVINLLLEKADEDYD